MKGVNSTSLDETLDPGQDGESTSLNANFARDVYGFGLHYYEGDYLAINGTGQNHLAGIANSDVSANSFDLFNGNIKAMQTTITNPDTRVAMPMANAYKYDQLNRLLESKSFINLANNQWGNAGTYDNRYYNAFEYDANGNIESQIRHTESGLKIEEMTYQYQKDGNGNLLRNRLYHINDPVAAGVWADDIDDMGAFTAGVTINTDNNYSFDEEGRLIRDVQEEIEEIVWRVDGKVKEVIRTSTSDKKNLSFDYDAMGRRIAKHVYNNQTGLLEKTTYYLLDAQGHTMNVYEHEVDDQDVLFTLKEQHIYGSSSLGIKMDTLNMFTATLSNTISTVLGRKYFHLSNHLSNNLTTINDIKIPVSSGTTVDYFEVGIVNVYDYSPFGVMLDGRTMESDFVRYGFQGQEKDDEIKGKGNSYDMGARFYDPRTGRTPTIDPAFREYPSLSSYTGYGNNPIIFVDPDGKRIIIHYKDETGKNKKVKIKQMSDIELLKDVEDQFAQNMYETLSYLRDEPTGTLEEAITMRKRVHVFEIGTKDRIDEFAFFYDMPHDQESPLPKFSIGYDPYQALEIVEDTEVEKMERDRVGTGEIQTPALGFLHEIGHFVGRAKDGKRKHSQRVENAVENCHNQEEERVIDGVETPAAIKLNEPIRTNHSGIGRKAKGPTSTEVEPRERVGAKDPKKL
jgi:RHS repeat-associated protein